jgi:hypothetical protein
LLTSTSRRGPQLEFAETFAIGAQGHFVVDARGHVAEMCRRNILPHDRLEVENVKRLRRLGNQLVKIARRPVDRVRWPQPFRQRVARQQWTRRQELQQAAAAG